MLGLLEGDAPDTSTGDLVRVLAIIAALSMHRGIFSAREFRRATRKVGDGTSRRSLLTETRRARATMRQLRRIGLVSRSHRRKTRYSFHEASAKMCIDRLSGSPAFRVPFDTAGRSRLSQVEAAGDQLRAWLIAVEVGEQETAERNFDAAMAQGSYTRMLRCLERAGERYSLSGPLRLQLAILLDRTGDFKKAREEFSDDLLQTLDPASELSMIFAVTRLEASHDDVSAAGLELLSDHQDPLMAIVGMYWKLHIAAHEGNFASEELLDLATEALAEVESRGSHWLDYSLGRMHFDSLRHFYLQGANPVTAVAGQRRRAIGKYLRSRLPSYEAFETLYTRAHLVGHVFLPQHALFFEPVTPEQAALAGVELRDLETVEGLVKTAQRLYRYAQDQFAQYGDREALYLKADVMNAEMIETGCELDRFVIPLRNYERFIDSTGFEDLASYPQFHFLRWHMLKYYETVGKGGSLGARRAKEHLDAARMRLRRITAFDTAANNQYGLMRAKLLGLLLRWVEKPPHPAELTALSRQMEERGYERERRLLDHLAGQGSLPILELRDIFRFYPFVGQ